MLISSSSVVQHFLTYQITHGSVGLAWFYCDGTRNLSAKTQTRYVLGSILRQLFSGLADEAVRRTQLRLLEQLQEKGRFTSDSELNRMLLNAVVNVSQHFREVFILV